MNPIWKLLLGATWFIALAGILWIGFLSTTDYIKRNAQWESEWTKAKGMNEELAKALDSFHNERKNMDVVLNAWKHQNDQSQREIADAKTRIRALEESNSQIRDILCTVIPSELWDEVFPASNLGKGDGSQDGGATCPSPAVPRPAGTKEKDCGRSSGVHPRSKGN